MLEIANYLIAFLLCITILYCWKLNRKIVELQHGKKEIKNLIKEFDHAILRAEEGVAELKLTGRSLSKELQENIKTSSQMVEDLNFMIGRASVATEKLEQQITASRDTESRLFQAQHQTFSTTSRSTGYEPSSQGFTTEPVIKPQKQSSIDMLLKRIADIKQQKQATTSAPKPIQTANQEVLSPVSFKPRSSVLPLEEEEEALLTLLRKRAR